MFSFFRLVRDMPGCRGCPLFGDGSQGFVPDELIENAPVLVMGQNPGEEEEAFGKPFVGKTGQAMERTYFKLAGLERGKVSIGNALRCRWQDSNELPPLVQPKSAAAGKRGQAEEALLHCQNAHGHIPSGTKLIVSQGEYALWSVSRQRSVTTWRGWLVPQSGEGDGWKSTIWTPGLANVPVLVTVHLAAIFQQPSLSHPTRMDWRKVPRILKGEWPQRFPGFHTDPPKVWPVVSAFDTEFTPETGELTRYSLYDGGDRPWVVEAQDVGNVPLGAYPAPPKVYMHNMEADILNLERMLGPRIRSFTIEDTMLMHAVLWSDLPHDLEYLGSLFARTNRWKHLGYESVDYSACDALGTWDVAMALTRDMKEDPQSYWIYRNSVFPLAETIMEAEKVGLALDAGRVNQAIEHFERIVSEVTLDGQAYAGYPINMGSPEQVGRWLYEVEGIRPPQARARKKVPRRA